MIKNKQICQESDEINDNVIVTGHVALPEANDIKYKSSDTVTIDSVVVDPEYRRNGFGKALMKATYYYINKKWILIEIWYKKVEWSYCD